MRNILLFNQTQVITGYNQNIWMQNDCILLFSMLSGNRSVMECVLVWATLPQSCRRVIRVRLWGPCDAAAEGYVCWMEGKLDGCKWALSLNGAVFLFMKDWLSRGMEGMNEICMERLYCTRPPAGLAINLSSVVCGLVMPQRRATHSRPKRMRWCLTAWCQSTNWYWLTPLQLLSRFWQETGSF